MPQEKALDYYMQSIENVFEECGAPDTIAAIVVEPLQGEGGFIPAPIEWVKAVREICDKYGILLIADEVQSGFCRTGRMFATEYWKEAGVISWQRQNQLLPESRSLPSLQGKRLWSLLLPEPSAEHSAAILWRAPQP